MSNPDLARRYELSDVPTFTRRADLAKLVASGAIGIELGVAEGINSERLLSTGRFDHFYSIDMWSGHRNHDVDEYKRALRRLWPWRKQSTALRMTFDEALDLFPDQSIDFIYVDGYAHTGQEGGRTLLNWYPKVRPGGIFSGDDYSEKFPLVISEVNAFVEREGLDLYLLKPTVREDVWSTSPSWVVRKPVT